MKVISVLHLPIFFLTNFIIVRIFGLEFSGSIHLLYTFGIFFSFIIGWRGDVELLYSSITISRNYVLSNIITASFIFIVLLTLIKVNFFFFKSQLSDLLLPALIFGYGFGVSEIIAASFFSRNKIIIYSFLKSSMHVAILFFVLLDCSLEQSFYYAGILQILISLSMLIFMPNNGSINVFIFEDIKNRSSSMLLSLLIMFYITLLTFFIFKNYGAEVMGLWSNSIRFLGLPISLFILVEIPFLIKSLGSSDKEFSSTRKYNIFFRNTGYIAIPTLMFSYFLGATFLSYILNIEINNNDFLLEFSIIINTLFLLVQNLTPIYQKMKRTLVPIIYSIISCLIVIFLSTFMEINLILFCSINISILFGALILHLYFFLFNRIDNQTS